VEVDARAVEPNITVIAAVHSGDDLDERRLAGTVLPDERVDRPSSHRQVGRL
jgi:hypothetical protein